MHEGSIRVSRISFSEGPINAIIRNSDTTQVLVGNIQSRALSRESRTSEDEPISYLSVSLSLPKSWSKTFLSGEHSTDTGCLDTAVSESPALPKLKGPQNLQVLEEYPRQFLLPPAGKQLSFPALAPGSPADPALPLNHWAHLQS